MLAINIISFIIMDLATIMMGKLVATRFGVLPRDTTNEGDRPGVLSLDQVPQLFEIGDLV